MQPTKESSGDDEYKRATKAVIDDTMRTDVLGPNLERVLRDHKPANDLVQDIVLEAVKNNTEVKTAVDGIIDSNETRKRSSLFIAISGAIGGAALAFVGSLLIELIKK